MTNFASERMVTASSEHRCYECGRTIAPGETYQRAAGSWFGDFWHAKTCAHCAAVRPILLDTCPDYGEDYYGGLWEHLPDCADGDPTLLRATVNKNRRWRHPDGTLVDIPTKTPTPALAGGG